MKARYLDQAIVTILLLCQFSICLATETSGPNESSKYLNAVREFADNVLKYGRDTYGPKHTPLFVDGLMVRDPNDPNYGKDGVFKPVEWIAPNGDRWILSNLASQQNLFRTLDGLTAITGDPKYKQAAMDAIKYAFENLQTPNGLLHWGGHQAYDAAADKPCGRWIHELKSHYPYYELMWQVDPKATKQFIEAFWSGHILDWSNLDMDRHCYEMKAALEKPWKYEYKGGPVFFDGKGLSFFNTGSDLIYAAAWLTQLSGNKEPLVWAKRLAKRYIDVRDPNTGISYGMYNPLRYTAHESYDDVLRKFVSGQTDFPISVFPDGGINPIVRECCLGYSMPTPGIIVHRYLLQWQSLLMVGEILGSEGSEFNLWALEELTAYGKTGYRDKDNVYVPMFTDGTNLEGYVVKVDGPLGPKGVILEPKPTGPSDFWAYTMAYRVIGDKFMWEMSRSIAKGNDFGDIGATLQVEPKLNIQTNCMDPYAILGFLNLYEKTGNNSFLQISEKIGENILDNRFHKGFFVASKKHIYTKFDAVDPLVLLHLYSALVGKSAQMPEVMPGSPFFDMPFRQKDQIIDNQVIYTLTTAEAPLSLQEAASLGNINLVRSIIEKGTDVDVREDSFYKTALHRAAIAGHKDVVELLLANSADTDARDSYAASALHYAAENGHKEIAELLIAKGADVNATSAAGDTPLQYAAYNNHKDIIELLLEKGAKISTIYLAAYMGDLAKVEAFIQEGVDIDALDGHGYAPLHYATQNSQKESAELLLTKGADVNVKNWDGQTPLYTALTHGHKDIVGLLLSKGANINAVDNKGNTLLYNAVNDGKKDIIEFLIAKGVDVNIKNNNGETPLNLAVRLNRKDIVELLLANGADVNAKNNQGRTPLDTATRRNRKDIADLLIAKGATVESIHLATQLGDVARVKAFLEQGTDVNAKDGRGYTPFQYAIFYSKTDIARLLIEKGAEINETDRYGYTPLHWVVLMGNRELTEFLLAKGADVNAKSKNGQRALHLAANRGHKDIADFLIAKGATVPSIHVAAQLGDVARVRVFLEQGIDVNAKDKDGLTPLHHASSLGNKDIIELLLAKGADLNAREEKGKTPLSVAREEGHTQIVELLRKHGAKNE